MTVSYLGNKIRYSGNGSNTDFTVPFELLKDTDLVIILRDETVPLVPVLTTLLFGIHYSFLGQNIPAGIICTGVRLGTPPTVTQKLIVKRVLVQEQPLDFNANSAFPVDANEEALDREVMRTQQVQEQLNRSMKLPETANESTFDPTLPEGLGLSPGATIAVKGDSTGFELGPTVSAIAGAAASAAAAAASATAADSSADSAEASATAADSSASNAADSAAAAAAAASGTLNPPLAKDVDYEFDPGDETVVWTAGSNALIGTLPTAVGRAGKRFTAKKGDADTGTLALATTGGETVEDLDSEVIKLTAKGDYVTVESDDVQWIIVAWNVSVGMRGAGGGGSLSSGSRIVSYNTGLKDPYGAFSGGNTFVAPIPGEYSAKASASFTRTFASGTTTYQLQILLNGDEYRTTVFTCTTAFSGVEVNLSVSDDIELVAGDQIQINAVVDNTSGGAALIGSATKTVLSITRIGN